MSFSDLQSRLKWRYATKQFDATRKISDSDFLALLESLRMAPSSFGLQPWKFVVVENPQFRAEIQACAWNQAQVTEASHLIVLCVLKEMTEAHVSHYVDTIEKTRGMVPGSSAAYKDRMIGFMKAKDQSEMSQWMKRQLYIAFGFLMLAAAEQGLDTCPIEGFDPKACDRILDLESQGLESVALCPVGYRLPTDKYATAAKVRFPMDEVVVWV
ncbi:MAG: NAD(P)H-dependent oxidoreductase [Candidatus Margulisiibacteriota bacterium]